MTVGLSYIQVTSVLCNFVLQTASTQYYSLPPPLSFSSECETSMAPVHSTMDLTGFKALSFDCYGTLINWKPNMIAALHPVLSRLPPDHPYVQSPQAAYIRFCEITFDLEISQPTLTKNHNLATGLRRLAAEVGLDETQLTKADIDAMADGPGHWPAFPDSVAALQVLKRRFKLMVLSNIDNANMERTVTGSLSPGGCGASLFDAVYTAEDIGAYKPSPTNFAYLHRRAKGEWGVDVARGELLHVAHGLRVDHTAAKQMGFPSCWIRRGTDRSRRSQEDDHNDAVEDEDVSFQWEFENMADFAAEVERQFGQQ